MYCSDVRFYASPTTGQTQSRQRVPCRTLYLNSRHLRQERLGVFHPTWTARGQHRKHCDGAEGGPDFSEGIGYQSTVISQKRVSQPSGINNNDDDHYWSFPALC